ncbi:ATP/GTP-binding protein [Streptomyces niveus]|uniref:GTP-binding protein n=1 Tax=Streptomyces niveus TaxID=193462 RepID=UPI0036BCE142
MRCTNSDLYVPSGAWSVKVVVLGPFAVGKTTLVGAVSEIEPLRTEELMTRAGELIDDLGQVRDKDTTTVAMDFGRLTLSDDIVLYLFGAPGQPRFADTVRDHLAGALGGLVMVNTRDVSLSFDSLTLVEQAGVPYVVVINEFPDSPAYEDGEIRESLDLAERTPLVRVDARYRESAKNGLIALATDILNRRTESPR